MRRVFALLAASTFLLLSFAPRAEAQVPTPLSCQGGSLHFPSELRDAVGGQPLNASVKELVVLIHGWTGKVEGDVTAAYNRYDDPDAEELYYLYNVLKLKLSGSSRNLVAYRWERDASTGDVWEMSLIPPAMEAGGYGNAVEAAFNARSHGKCLGDLLGGHTPNLRAVQFIAHSAGSWAAYEAAKVLLTLNPYVVVQVTLLDPFIPDAGSVLDADSKTGLSTALMSGADLLPGADRIHRLQNYYADETLYWNVADQLLPTVSTQEVFEWRNSGYTGRDSNLQIDWGLGYYDFHSGPIEFYADTVASTMLAPGEQPEPGLVGGLFIGYPSFDYRKTGWHRSIFQDTWLPKITDQPEAPVMPWALGSTVALSVSATNTNSFQWFKNGLPYPETSSTLTLPNLSAADAGEYVVRAKRDYGLVFSNKVVVNLVTSISPSTGPTQGGTLVTITGTGFMPGASVGIGGVLATDVTVLNATTITAVTAARVVGAADVFVESPGGHPMMLYGGFTYTLPAAVVPSVVTGLASSVTQTTAVVSATVNPNGSATSLYFDYGPTTGYGSTATYGAIGFGTAQVAYVYSLTGLTCGTTYQYQARAQSSGGAAGGGNRSFTTSACSQQSAAELVTNGSFAAGATGWTLSGNFFADARFPNCRSCGGYAYLSNADGTPGNSLLGTLHQTVTIPATATSAALTFWYSISTQETTAAAFDVLNVTIQNASGTYLGAVVTLSNLNATGGYVQLSANLMAYAGQTVRLHFTATTNGSLPTVFRVDDASIVVTTAAAAPTVATGSANAIGLAGATLNGSVNPQGSPTAAWFRYGPTASYGSDTASQSVGAATSSVSISREIAGLMCGTLYHFQAVGQNAAGTRNGSDQTFTTGACVGGPAPTIRVSIVPQSAADAGAQWKLTTETNWHNSGQSVPVPSLGTYVVQFKAIPGWTTPANRSVVLSLVIPDIWIDSDPYVQTPVAPLFQNFSGITFGNGEFVAVGGSTDVVTTPDGVNWARNAGLSDNSPRGINYATGLFVAVGYYNNAGRIMTSPNGRDWTSRLTDSAMGLPYGVTYGQGLHVAVGARITTSSDGTNWVVQGTSYSNSELLGVTYGNHTFVATRANGRLLISSDGFTWDTVTPPGAQITSTALVQVVYANSQFVAVGWGGKILTSSDGMQWVRRDSSTSDLLIGVTYANNTFVAVGDGGRVVTSPDGVNWTSRNAGTDKNLRGVAFGNNTFVAAGHGGALIPLGNTFVPLIATQPASQTGRQGEDVTFSVVTSGAGPITYQWRFEGVDIPGETGAFLTLHGIASSQAGNYSVVVQSPSARQVSQAASLAVIAKSTPVITWPSPTPIVYGTALSTTQLNASSSVVGTFVYTPPAGTTLNVGAGQTLSVVFTPTDSTNYTTAVANVTIDVTAPGWPTVTVTATDANASEVGLDPGTFTFARTGPTTAALTVNFTTMGAATVTRDYADVGWTSVSIPIGQASATKTVTPVADALVEGAEAVVVTLASGGYTIGSPSVATVTIADAPDPRGTWSTGRPMPTPRYGLVVAVVGAKVYAIGGQLSGTTLDAVEEYDPVADAWTSRAPMPTPRRHPAAAVVNGKIYVIGGYSDSLGVLDAVEEYDPSTDTWTTKASLPTPNYYLQAEALNGKIYAIGGYNARDAVEEYSPVTDTWTAKAPMPTPRWAFASGVVNGRIYAIGGYMDGPGVLASAEEYNPQTDVWVTKASMPTARVGPSAAVVYSSIFVMGGESGVDLNTVERYNAASNEWTAMPSMPTPSVALSSGALNGKIYAMGGLLYLPGGPTFLDTVQVLTLDSLVAGQDLKVTAFSAPPATASPGTAYVVSDTTVNQGAVQAGASTTRYYLSLDAVRNSGDRVLTGTRAVPSLSAGVASTGPTTVTIPASVAPGTYFQLACADDLKTVTESNEANNCLASAGTVQVVLPDLLETAVSNPPVSVAPGGKFTITDTVLNPSGVGAAASSTRYYLSLDAVKGPGDVLLSGARSVLALAAGASSAGSRQVTVPAATALQTYRLLACADDQKKVAETNEGNNCLAAATSVVVGVPDLTTTQVSNPPVTAVPGTKITLTDTVRNQGTAPTVASSTKYYLSVDGAWSPGDVLLTGSRSVPILAPGATSAGSRSVTVPLGTLAGPYFALACADDTKKVIEGNETNNCLASVSTIVVGP